MDNLSGYANRPFAFVLRYLRERPGSHAVILSSVVAAVACSVGTQYGVKFLVDGLSGGPASVDSVWLGNIAAEPLIGGKLGCHVLRLGEDVLGIILVRKSELTLQSQAV